jgi:hypothetical protein
MRLESVQTTEGHLRDAQLKFSEHLNCIIGARGTCKSTVIETIRFLFDDDPDRVAALLDDGKDHKDGPAHRGLIQASLKGGTARLEIEDGGSVTSLERDVNSEPRLYIDGVKAIDEPSVLDRIEIYSQGELQDIATQGQKRLELIDRRHKSDIDRWRHRAGELAGQIADIGPELRELRETIEAAEAKLKEGEPRRHELERLRSERPELSTTMSDLRVEYQRGEALQARAAQVAERYTEGAERARDAARQLTLVADDAKGLGEGENAELAELAAAVGRSAEAMDAVVSRLVDQDEIDRHLEAAKSSFAASSVPYHEALKQEEQIAEAVKKEDRLVEEVGKLDAIASELKRHRERLASRMTARSGLRAELHELRSRIFERRLAEVEDINAKHSNDIVLALTQGTQTGRYREKIEELLDGSRMRDRPRLCSQLAAAFPPVDLVSAVESDDAARLASALDRDIGQMMRLVSHLGASDDLYALEGELPEDELDITMFVDGVARSVAEMSKGQKATAILPLLLRAADYPLVLDQPEDDLDNRFIYRTLLERIRELKSERQLIFVTHNANIPVVGDAERVFVMEMGDRARVKWGSVDDMRESIVELLEGGESAFKLRSRIYGYSDPDNE